MAYLEKRGKRWMAQIFHKGERISKTFPTKTHAMEWAAEQEKAKEAGERGELPSKTFADLCERYSIEVAPTKDGCRWEQLRLAKIVREASFKHRLCHAITSDHIGQWRDARSLQVAPASVSRELELLHGVFERARREWKWVRFNPVKDVTKPKSPPPRRRGIKQWEINAILRALKWHGEVITKRDLIAVAFLLAIETGMRAGELLSLNPATVDLKSRVAHLPKTKNGDARDVPLSMCAVQLLELVGCRLAIASTSLDTLFRRYRGRTDVQDLHFHDARSEAISRLSRKMDVLELAQMVGHRDLKSLLFYYKRSASELARKL